MDFNAPQNRDVRIWVSKSGTGIRRRWREIRDRVHRAGPAGETVRQGGLHLLCLSDGQNLGIGVGETATPSGYLQAIGGMLAPETLDRLEAAAPEQRRRRLSLLYYQRVALAHALKLDDPFCLWRVNPLFVRGDYGPDGGGRDRIVGGFLLKTLDLGDEYTGVLCCSPSTGEVVVEFI